ncbi:uncharacterized protein MONOS_13136 [Monocercomonoides exilis]|uniref:uncharacterized protein n=1 Tax=Monocercomonoides exilis TaxID=2049356 RepID=UPI00355A466B|nr:hypothetical protein MONOS_13136 [Monocercomonoides exilis]|eukprot:MONOS_13136.1-p1 / transcript=MONOS_13136.1 / gene=MONOS_13136 / organism=Monocercomonoides_exilis_PA203 / gene_product=unspecified product / transcript_product=unspecified product / location=Mono_scaffold00782:7578-8759(-) / protein_length=394 / sequence_SO=supercontig / SO=protein_coding / is_pseudo=false
MAQGTEHPPLLPQPSALSQPGADAQGGTAQAGTLKASLTGNSKSTASTGASRISKKDGGQHKSNHSMPQHQLGDLPRSQFPSPQLLRGYKEDQQQGQHLDRANGPRKSEEEGDRALPRDRERRESNAMPRDRDKRNAIEFRGSDNATGSLIKSTDSTKNGTRGSLREQLKGIESIRSREEDRSRDPERPRDGCMEREHRRRLRRSPQDKTEEQSLIWEGEKEGSLESFWEDYRAPNWENSGCELEDSYCRHFRRRREYTDTVWPQDARSEEESSVWTTEGATSGETGEQTERVEEDWGRQTSEPWYKSSMEKSSIPNFTRGEKTQTRISGNNGDDEQLFIPLGGGIEGRSGEAHCRVGGEVVQPDIHGDKEKRKVEKDTRLQEAKRRSAGKAF